MTCGRRPIQEVRTEKARGRLPGAGFVNSCDDANMPVICPTCQISFEAVTDPPSRFPSVKSLDRRRRGSLGGKRRSPDGRRRTRRGDRLLLRCGAGLCCMSRAGSRWRIAEFPKSARSMAPRYIR